MAQQATLILSAQTNSVKGRRTGCPFPVRKGRGLMRFRSLSAAVCAAMIFGVAAHADGITVMVNGTEVISDVPAQMMNDRTMLPMRSVFEALGADVTWMGDDRLIFATSGASMIVMQIDNDKMSVQRASEDGMEVITLDSPPYVYNDRTMVPVRAVAEALGASVEWDGDTKTVTITNQ